MYNSWPPLKMTQFPLTPEKDLIINNIILIIYQIIIIIIKIPNIHVHVCVCPSVIFFSSIVICDITNNDDGRARIRIRSTYIQCIYTYYTYVRSVERRRYVCSNDVTLNFN